MPLAARSSATPPPGTIPSSTAAFVACMASSTRAFFSFISVSVAAPDLDDRDTTHQLRQPLLQLLAVVVRGRVLDLRAELLDPTLDGGLRVPAPSTIVVLSLSIVTFLALPRSSILMLSSLMPRSSVMALPP